jgi:F-type H+-transporting ATPase subunit delta
MSTEYLAASKYAKALFGLALAVKQEEPVAEELDFLAQTFGKGEGLALMIHPLLASEKKKDLLKKVLGANIGDLTSRLLDLLVERGRGALLPMISQCYREQVDAHQATARAEVRTARPLTPEQLKRLQQRLEAYTGKQITLQVKVQEQLQAGTKIILGDLVFDGSLTGRLERLKKTLLSSN